MSGLKPNEAVGPRHDVGLEGVGVARADLRIDAVAGDDEVGIGVIGVGVGLVLKHQFHAHFLAARLQDVEHFLASNAHEAVATASDGMSLEVQLDVVPVVEGLLHFGGRLWVAASHVLHGGIGEHHAPTEGVVGLVALNHRDIVKRVLAFHQQGEVQAGCAATNADDFHFMSAHQKQS